MIGLFGYWYKYKRNDSKYFGGAESQGLLHEEKVNYDNYQPVH